MSLSLKDQQRLQAVDGWLGLGNCLEANDELERIATELHSHPDVLFVRWHVCAMAKNWILAAEVADALSKLAPDNPVGAIHLAYALHEMKRTKEAWDTLLPAVDRFPDNRTVRYNLACYACQLGDLTGAWDWLSKAFDLSGEDDLRQQALDDPDLKGFRARPDLTRLSILMDFFSLLS